MMAATLDGYVADARGGVGFLNEFQHVDWGWSGFIAEIGTVVMGRKTYDHIWQLTPDWPYPDCAGIVLGHPAEALHANCTLWRDGLDALVAHLRALDGKDVWIVGGPSLQAQFIAKGALDRLELCLVPRLIGTGIRLFPDTGGPALQPRLHASRSLPEGMVLLDYRFGARGGRER
ncbi:dihydrofolate reductase family protein [Paragemmobacter straminiformis]|uniref:Dihydrofolate reductase n=1 Tax=Paragemmobacter straminiformis TaxID=2045119 RepID=A0A842IDB9_9RHOB|nr:dihydrofolate reductase family protein [Gemmobacter straminiformis]MBC2837519.1 dihydrofolate reductase [Gemmobacter straminiformis]